MATPISECPECRAVVDGAVPACPVCGHYFEPARCERHPDRVARGRCPLCGTAVCEECDTGTRAHYRCPEHRTVEIIEGWAQILMVANDVEAKLIEENLRADGIDSRVLSQKDHSAFPVELGNLARVRILVPTFDYQTAERVIAGHRDGAGEVYFGCPSCGEAFEEGERVCSGCGAPLP